MDLIELSRDLAIKQADDHADPDWKETAYDVGVEVAHNVSAFTSEDIFDAMPPAASTHEPRAMGAVMRRLAKDGVIEATDHYTTSSSKVGHGRPSRIWKSKVYGRWSS